MITFRELISLKTNIVDGKKVKYVRHKDSRSEYKDIIKDVDKLISYQKEQSNPVFSNCDYILSFVGQEGTKALFLGIFKVEGVEERNGKYHYDLKALNELSSFKDRVVIDWGDATRNWHQWFDKNEKFVVEILPEGYLGDFPGLLNIVLEFNELEKLVRNPNANLTWYHRLSSINAIYMILDEENGNQYIGSACGNLGLWQRWSEYVKTKHGNNKSLIELYRNNKDCYKNFTFSVLQTLPSNVGKGEIEKLENLYKKKFGTKSFGLNEN
ncbi:GIY-YIG nuclease family protein [Salinivibrio sp. IB282]|uniref:GIY-YIG nuclease family protein n=1 Tax=Salinivibrio sp. IB282 TaxID=1766122 RepID=UPI00098840F6|nr:GIY-YIG nuclease family protein [Salinivibrio sp. IB282]OOE56970.1 hypothetical protein BZG14_15345 [Salinivibrio sp. IB282]